MSFKVGDAIMSCLSRKRLKVVKVLENEWYGQVFLCCDEEETLLGRGVFTSTTSITARPVGHCEACEDRLECLVKNGLQTIKIKREKVKILSIIFL